MSEASQPMFRAMKAEADGLPKVGRSSSKLGVRVEGLRPDLPVEPDGTVEPGTGGMSVALDAARNLPEARRPKFLGGEGRDPVFSMSATDLAADLGIRTDHYPHALVEPARKCLLDEFESALAATRPSWRMIS